MKGSALPLLVLLILGCGPGTRGAPARDADVAGLPTAAADTVRIMVYNIHHGEGMDDAVDLGRIARLIGTWRPDLVALQEVDRGVARTNGVDQARVLGELTNLAARFGTFMPYQGGEYGMAILSAWPIVSVENHRLPDGEEPRSALTVRVRSPRTGRDLDFVGIHLYRTEIERLAQAMRVIELFRGESTPSVLAGDFNSQPGSAVLDALRAVWHFVDKGPDRLTFPSWAPEREIDFVAYRPATEFEVRHQLVVDEPVISDHRPLFVELVW